MSQSEDPWASLAEELGLVQRAAPKPPAPPIPTEPRQSALPATVPVPPDSVGREPAVPQAEMQAGQPSERVEPGIPETGGAAATEPDKPRSRRRRRRRGRKEAGAEGAEAGADNMDLPDHEGDLERAETSHAAEAPIADQLAGELAEETTAEAGAEGTRRRRRRRHRGERTLEAGTARSEGSDGPDNAAADEEEEEVSPEHAVDEDDTEEVDDLSNWSVPSWTELIGGLYRPPDR